MSTINPLVDEVNKLLETITYDGTNRIIPMNVVPNYANEQLKIMLLMKEQQ